MSDQQPNLEGYEFLKETFSTNRLQIEARNILDSYSHTWDILAESLQNSVDAIEQNVKENPNAVAMIQVVFNANLRSIEISDTGIGMSLEQVKSVLAPHQGFKRGKGLRGEKGVGLSFILFSTNRFRIETCDGKQTISLEIHRANDWVNGTENQPLKFLNVSQKRPQSYQGSATYTRIWAEQIPQARDSGEDIFEYSEPRLIYILRTKTALGNTYPLFNTGKRPPIDIKVILRYIDHKGTQENTQEVPYSFASPDTLLRARDVLNWDEFKDRLVQGKNIQAKGFVHGGVYTSDSGKSVNWYAFITSRLTFDEISEVNNLQTSEAKDVDGGIYISTRGMPTGIRLTPPRTQQASYWPAFFILLEYDDLRLDMGRKFVGGRVGQMLTKVASFIFNQHVNAIPQLTSKASDPFDGLETDLAIEDIKDKVNSTPNLDLPQIPYLKVPVEEQGVIAIFHELVGAGLLKGYRTQRSFFNSRYDIYIRYEPDLSVISANVKTKKIPSSRSYNFFAEFKYEGGQSLLEDFEVRKRPRDFRLLICWTLNEKVFRDDHIEIEEVEYTETAFHGATHKLIFPNSYGFGSENTLHVIVLKDLIKILKKLIN